MELYIYSKVNDPGDRVSDCYSDSEETKRPQLTVTDDQEGFVNDDVQLSARPCDNQRPTSSPLESTQTW